MHNNILFLKMAFIYSMKITFPDSFLPTYAILMILVWNHTYLTMQNVNFDLRNSVMLISQNMRLRIKIYHAVDLRQKQNILFVGRLFVWGIITKHNYVEKGKNKRINDFFIDIYTYPYTMPDKNNTFVKLLRSNIL